MTDCFMISNHLFLPLFWIGGLHSWPKSSFTFFHKMFVFFHKYFGQCNTSTFQCQVWPCDLLQPIKWTWNGMSLSQRKLYVLLSVTISSLVLFTFPSKYNVPKYGSSFSLCSKRWCIQSRGKAHDNHRHKIKARTKLM